MSIPLPPIPERSTSWFSIVTKGGVVVKALSTKDLPELWNKWLQNTGEKPDLFEFINGSVLFNEIASITKWQ